ncbi:hypothetical protein PUN28_008461 [Cardiocondyla obscurior]|uniref:Ribosomal protein S18 n=1 Tax=Cardiocondyla obscurior TaxID=286306 RepID=A0AAW2G2S1_9HYME
MRLSKYSQGRLSRVSLPYPNCNCPFLLFSFRFARLCVPSLSLRDSSPSEISGKNKTGLITPAELRRRRYLREQRTSLSLSFASPFFFLFFFFFFYTLLSVIATSPGRISVPGHVLLDGIPNFRGRPTGKKVRSRFYYRHYSRYRNARPRRERGKRRRKIRSISPNCK